jgi:hypothetical protein
MYIENIEGEDIDRCPGCRGMFFDKGELQSISKLVSLFSDVGLEEEEIDTIPLFERERKLKCPHCEEPMVEQDVGGGYVIDICTGCEGIWLDFGELAAIKLLEEHIRKNVTLYIRLGN